MTLEAQHRARGAARSARVRASHAALLALGLALTGAAVQLRAARARADELVRGAGLHALAYARALHLDPQRTLRVNGLPLRIASGYTDDPVPELLDFFHRGCRTGSPPLVVPHAAAARALGWDRGARLEPVVRVEDEGGGYLGCLDLGGERVGVEALLRRGRAFAASGDLSALGDLRFVWAMREGEGTAYVAVATSGEVPLARLFPERGDAPGVDLPGIPRPPRGRRVLSAYQEHTAPAIVSYRVELPAAAAHAQYRGALIDGGFAVREHALERGRAAVFEAQRGDTHAAVVITPEDDLHCTVTLLPLR